MKPNEERTADALERIATALEARTLGNSHLYGKLARLLADGDTEPDHRPAPTTDPRQPVGVEYGVETRDGWKTLGFNTANGEVPPPLPYMNAETMQARADSNRNNAAELFPDLHQHRRGTGWYRVAEDALAYDHKTCVPVVFTPYGYLDDPEYKS